jgi:hypothetical protein
MMSTSCISTVGLTNQKLSNHARLGDKACIRIIRGSPTVQESAVMKLSYNYNQYKMSSFHPP